MCISALQASKSSHKQQFHKEIEEGHIPFFLFPSLQKTERQLTAHGGADRAVESGMTACLGDWPCLSIHCKNLVTNMAAGKWQFWSVSNNKKKIVIFPQPKDLVPRSKDVLCNHLQTDTEKTFSGFQDIIFNLSSRSVPRIFWFHDNHRQICYLNNLGYRALYQLVKRKSQMS